MQNEHELHFGYAWFEFSFMHDIWMIMVCKCWRYTDWEFIEAVLWRFWLLNTDNSTKYSMIDVVGGESTKLDNCYGDLRELFQPWDFREIFDFLLILTYVKSNLCFFNMLENYYKIQISLLTNKWDFPQQRKIEKHMNDSNW